MALLIRLLSQGLIVHNPPAALVYYLEKSLHPSLIAPKLKRERGKFIEEDGDCYFHIDKIANDYYYHIDKLPAITALIEMAQSRGQVGEFELIRAPRSVGTDVKFKNYKFDLVVPEDDPEIYDFYGWQNDVSDKACEPDAIQTIFEVQTGRGKAQSNNEPVLTPSGWVPMGSLAVGDYVIGSDGKPTKIIGVYPQGTLPIYEFSTHDNRSVKVCGEHLWQSFYVNTTDKRRWGVRDTKEMQRLLSLHNPRLYIPLNLPVEYKEQVEELPIDPYVLGVLIGDGSFTSSSVTVVGPDLHIFTRVGMRIGTGDRLVVKDKIENCMTLHIGAVDGINKTKNALISVGLFGKRSWEKTIPEVYFQSSIEERWELLRGLMDTDGTVNKDGGQPSYCTSSEELAYQVRDIARSLGCIVRVSCKKEPKYSYKGEKKVGRPAYIVFFRLPKPSMLFTLDRKKDLCKDDGQYTDILKVRVKSIVEAGEAECTCIKVEAEDELFITKDFIVTHNTKCLQKVMVRRAKRTVIIARPAYADKWRKDCVDDETALYEPSQRVKVVKGVEGINALLSDGLSGDLDKKNISTIIIPTTSFKLWLQAHAQSVSSKRINLWEFYEILGAGLVAYDEIHEHFHTVYLTGIILNPPILVEMSATLKPGKAKEFIRQRYMERFPKKNRVSVEIIRICKVGYMYYSIGVGRMVNRSNGMPMYNHKVFEDYLYQHSMVESYFEMVYDVLERGFLKSYQTGQRALVFFSLVQSCTDFREYCVKRMKEDNHPEMVVNRYVGVDNYSDLMSSDIAISTPGKAGTAVDLPKLVIAIVTTAIDDRQLNEQITGRPRKIRAWANMDPKVIFLHARELKKHNMYLASRRDALSAVALSQDVVNGPYRIHGEEKENKFLSPTKSHSSPEKSKMDKVSSKFKKLQANRERLAKRQAKANRRKNKGKKRWR